MPDADAAVKQGSMRPVFVRVPTDNPVVLFFIRRLPDKNLGLIL